MTTPQPPQLHRAGEQLVLYRLSAKNRVPQNGDFQRDFLDFCGASYAKNRTPCRENDKREKKSGGWGRHWKSHRRGGLYFLHRTGMAAHHWEKVQPTLFVFSSCSSSSDSLFSVFLKASGW